MTTTPPATADRPGTAVVLHVPQPERGAAGDGDPSPGRWAGRMLPRPSTPLLLRLGMALACLPVVLFAAAVQLGVERNDDTVRTVALDTTRGITVAQAIKLNLAELDEIVVRGLLDPVALGSSGFTADYDDKRVELHDNLVAAAAESSSGAAYRQPLVNIEYALAHYHTLVKDAFAAHARSDEARAVALYASAHEVMDGTLLPEADFVDKANTYVLNNSYDTQKERSATTVRLIVVSWAVLLGFLAVAQVLMARMFRRVLNVGLVAATVVALATGAFALTRLGESKGDLTTAREQAFDSVHVLARAGATVVSARQSEGHLLLDPAAAGTAADFTAQARKLFRVQSRDDVTSLAQAGAVPEGAGGYLATVAAADLSGPREEAARQAIVAFGDFLAADADMRQLLRSGDTTAARSLYRDAKAFNELANAIDDAQAVDQGTFDAHAIAASDATAQLDRISLVGAAAVLALVLLGFQLRLREYGR